MLTYTQDFSPYQSTPAKLHAGDANPEGKAAARRRRQMERQQRKRPEPPRVELVAQALTQQAAQVVMEIEAAQDARLAQHIEVLLEPPPPPEPAKKKGVTQATLIEWYQKWHKPLRSWLKNRASVPPGDVDDLAQEVFIRLMKYCNEDTEVENPQGYIFRVASNVATEWRERSRNSKPHDMEWLDELMLEGEHQPDQIYERGAEDRRVSKALSQLRPRQQEIVQLHVTEDMTYNQIAQARGLTYRIVLRDLTKAYATLRAQLPRSAG